MHMMGVNNWKRGIRQSRVTGNNFSTSLVTGNKKWPIKGHAKLTS